MFSFLKKSLEKTTNAIKGIKGKNTKISKSLLEDMLIEADVTYEIVEEILYYLPPSDIVDRKDLKRVLSTYFMYENEEKAPQKPFVELVLGVNGVGKTTSIGKLSHYYKQNGKKVILGACDTFRAGAIMQLELWAERNGVDIVSTKQGHDPSAVAYDTISKALAKGYDNVILDTAGRLENQKNLAKELEKIIRISDKAFNGAPHRKLLVLDATQGNSGINQAMAFNDLVKLDGIIITKLDGTSRGGSLFAVARELELPILYYGFGESAGDFDRFDVDKYLDTLLDAIFDGVDEDK